MIPVVVGSSPISHPIKSTTYLTFKCFEQALIDNCLIKVTFISSKLNSESRINGYEDKAAVILQDFSNQLLEDEFEALQEQYQPELIDELKKAHPFSRGLLLSLATNLLTLCIIAAMMFIIWSMNIGITEVIGQVFDVNINSKQ